MAEREFDIHLFNHSDATLVKISHPDHELCHGEWTEPLRPPDRIPPAPTDEVRFKSESSGLGTGVQGFVKYQLEGSSEVLCITWDNPFAFGVTKFKVVLDTTNITVRACEIEPDGDSTFPGPAPRHRAVPNNFSNDGSFDGFVTFVSELPLAPVFIFGNMSIDAHARLDLTVANLPTSLSALTALALRGFTPRNGFDPAKGIRPVFRNTGITSLRQILRIP